MNVALLAAVVIALAVTPGVGFVAPSQPTPQVAPGTDAAGTQEIDPGDVRKVAALAPTPEYTEDFENNINNTATGAQSLVSGAAGGTTYTGLVTGYLASPNWSLGNYCNGVVLSANNSSQPAWTGSTQSNADSKCRMQSTVQSYNGIRTLARAMGHALYNGDTTKRDNNHIVSSYTECGAGSCTAIQSGATNGVMFDTASDLTVPQNRYYTFSVDTVAINCGTGTTTQSGDPQYQFQLKSSGTGSNIGSAINACRQLAGESGGNTIQSVTVPNLQSIGGATKIATVRSILADRAIKHTGSTLGVKMYSASGVTNGNDGGFDNVRVVDVTPTMEKSFSPAFIEDGGTTTLTITIVNRTDLLEKQDFSFTDTLDAGLTIAGTPVTDCVTTTPNGGSVGTVSAPLNGSTLTADGLDLAKNQGQCTVKVLVKANGEKTYSNGAANINPSAFVVPPTDTATLQVRSPRISVTKALGSTRVKAGDQFTTQIRTGSATGAVVSDPTNATSAGTGNTVTAGTGVTGKYKAVPATTYHLTEAAAGGADLSRYNATVTCTDSYGLQTGLPTNQPLGASLAITPVVGADISCTITNTAKDPSITLQKVMSGTRTLNSDQFTVQIRNGSATGPVVGTTANATTTGTGSAVTPGTGVSTLANGTAGTSYTVTEVGGGLTNLLLYNKTVTCVDAAGATSGLPTNASVPAAFTAAAGADITCTLTNRAILPEVDVTKTFVGATVNPATGGGTATYQVTVKNTSVAATSYGPLTDTPQFGPGITATGATWSGQSTGSSNTAGPYQLAGLLTSLPANTTHTYTVQIAYTGTTTATCAGPNTGLYNSATLPAGQETGATNDNGACGQPASTTSGLTLAKTGALSTDTDSDGKGDVGDVITYTFTVTNTGNVNVNSVTITDPKAGPATCTPATVPAGGTTTCTATHTITQADVNAGTTYDNSATASGTPAGSSTPVTSPPATATTPLDRRSASSVVKSSTKVITDVDGNGPDAGDTVAYSFLVKNEGTTTLTGVTVNDAKIPGPISCPTTTLAPGATTTCTATYTITAADVAAGQIVNSATVSVTPPGGDPVVTSPPSTITVPVPQPPTARDDSTTTKQGDAVTLTPSTNDTAVAGHTINPASVRLIDPTSGAPVTSVTVPNQGTWTVAANGDVTFTPVPSFTGTATPVTYRVADDQGATSTATLNVTVTPVIPVARPESVFTPANTTVQIPLLANDSAGDPTAPLVPNTTRLQDSTGAWVTSVTVPGEGTWSVNTAGVATFVPEPGFTGVSVLPYRVADENGTFANSTVRVTVGTPAETQPDSATTPQNVTVTLSPLDNDEPGTAATWVTSSVELRDPADGTWKKTVTTAAGTWTVKPDGTVDFDPVPGFTGTTPTIDYRAVDSSGLRGTSTLEVTVTPINPTAGNDRLPTPFRTPVTVPVLGNDSPGAATAPLDASTVQLKDPADGTWKKTVTTPEGTYAVQTNGEVIFTPSNQFRGTTTPLDYRVADANGTRATATITIDVAQPAAPTANPDSTSTPQGVAVDVNPLTNDTKSSDNGDFVPSSVKLWNASTNTWVTSLTVPGEGTWAVNTTTGVVTFDPEPTFTGAATGVSYQVTDSNGAQAESVITVTVTPVTPALVDDTSSTPFATPVSKQVLDNDKPGDPNVPLDPSTLTLLDSNGDPVTTVTVPGGVFTVDPATGKATFTPNVGFTGTAVVTYQVADANGTTSTATWTVTVGAPPAPALTPDTDSTKQGVPVTTDVLANDDVTAAGGTLVPATVQISDDGGATWLSAGDLAGRGTFTVKPTGEVVFTPLPEYVGTFTVDYRVADSYGTYSTSTLEITVTPVTPTATDDSDSTPYQTPVTLDVAANDTAGDPAVALVPSSVRLLDGTTPVTSLTVSGEGTWTVDTTTGKVTFSPDAGFTGVATPVDYQIADVNGTTATASIEVTVELGPDAKPDTESTKQAVPVVISPLGNDTPGTGGTWKVDSVELLDPADGTWKKSVTTVEGTWTVATDGTVTFSPVATYTGTTPAMDYRATDSYGNTDASTITVTVNAITPDAVNDSTSTAHATLVNVPVLGNDTPGDPTAPLVSSSVRLVTPGTGALVTDLTTAEGTWHVKADGSVDFTPVVGFTGVASLDYSVADANGTRDTATIQVTVEAGPQAAADTGTTPQNVTVTVDLVGNDTAGPRGTIDATTVVFTSPDATNGGRSLTTPEGTWTIDPATGAVTFDPNPTFTGTTASVGYSVKDSYGNTASSTVTITVTPITPVADNDHDTTPYQTPVTVNVLDGDTPGAATAPLVPSSVRLVDPDTGAHVTSVTTNQGTYTVRPDGRITFDPADGFTGTTTPVSYVVSDSNGTVSNPAELTIEVTAGPSAVDDTFTTLQGVASEPIKVLDNDTPSVSATWDPASVIFTSPDATDGGKKLVVPGEGTWTVNPDGTVVFTPEPTFVGPVTPVTYRVTDSLDNSATAQITSGIVTAVTPAPQPDTAKTPYLTSVTFNVTDNDTPGDPSAPIVPGTVKLVDGTDLVDELTTPEGVWKVASNGQLTFTPADGFSGDTPPVTYSVADKNGTRATSTAVVTVGTPPLAADDSDTTPQNTPVTVPTLANDAPGSGVDGTTTLVPGSVKLTGPGTSADGKTRTVAGEGTWTVASNGDITFAPEPQFTGAAATGYTVEDTDGNTARATVTITVESVTPTAVNDTEKTPFKTPVTLDPLANDVPGTANGTPIALDPTTVIFTSPDATDGGKKLVVPGEGTWTIDPTTGEVTFDPEPTFAGVSTPVTYQVKDANGTPTEATLAVTVGKGPEAVDDTNTTKQGQPVTTTVVTNDSPGAGGNTPATLVPESIKLVDPATGDEVSTLTVAGVGTWTVEPNGDITFAPVGDLTTPASIDYTVTDSDGNKATATLTITITAINPTAAPDEAKTPYKTPVTLDVVANDTPGDTTAPLRPASLKLVDGTNLVDTLTVPGVGEWTVVSGELVFTPADGFSGVTPAVTYSVADANGTRVTSTATVTVGAPPAAAPDHEDTIQGQSVVVDLLGNDTPGEGVDGSTTLVPTSVVFTSPDATNGGKTLVVPGEGTWTVNPDGTATFAPEPTFTGITTPVDYRVSDSDGNTATSSATVTVTEVTPVANPDQANTPFGDPVTVPVLGNDTPGDPTAPLVPSSVVFTSPDATNGGKTLVVPGVGTWTVNPDGTVRFTPEPSYFGTTPPVTYQVSDANGTPVTSTVQVTVGAPPVANPDRTTTLQGQPVDLEVLKNDAPGEGVDGSTTLVPGSVIFTSSDATDGGKTLVVPGQGTWTVGPDDVVTFTPLPGFTAVTTPVDYQVTDSDGNTATSTVTVEITPITPIAVPDAEKTPYLTPVTVPVLGNDSAGDPVAPLEPTSVVFTNPNATDGGKTLVVPDQGTWTIDPTTGAVTFTPVAGFTGDATTSYQVADKNGTTATSTVTVSVGTPPKANDDSTTTPQNVTVTFDVAANDVPGSGVDGTTTIVKNTVRLVDANGDPVTSLTTPEGEWSVDSTTGEVTFDPNPDFVGTATVPYQVKDSDGNTASATFSVTVTAINPTATNDETTTPFNTAVTIPVADNDTEGAATAPLVPSTVVFTSPDATNGGKDLTTPEGTWSIDADGVVTFTPATGWVGVTAPVEYSIKDSNGTPATATITVTVNLPAQPNIVNDSDTTFQNENVTVPVLANDQAAPGATLDPSTVVITTTGATNGGKTLVVPGEGTWTVNPDGTITFDPEPAFTGTATPIVYSVEDNYGQAQTAQVTVVVTPITPTAEDDLDISVPFGNPAVVPVLDNDAPGRPSAPLDPTSVTFTSPDSTDGGKTLVVPGEGTWTVNPDGTVTFTPEADFAGVTTPVTYQVKDTNGTPATAEVGVTVRSRPLADPDSTTTKQDINVTLTPLTNDTPGGGAGWNTGSVKLYDATNDSWVTELTVPNVGTWTVNPDGTVTFDPVPTYTGTTTVSYQVTDTDGGIARSTLTVTVTPIIPVVEPDKAKTPYQTPVTVPVLDNDAPGDPSAPIEKVELIDPTTGDPVSTVTVPGVGTWTVTPDNEVTFTPEPGFDGDTTITYQVTDENGTTSTSTVTVTVGTAPTAQPDEGTELQGFPVTIDVLDNDTPGSGGNTPATKVPDSVVFTSPDATDGGKTLVVPGEGTWTVNPDGTVTFTPEPTFTGRTTPVTYEFTDSDGNTATSTVTADLTPVNPQAQADTARTPAKTPVTLPVLDNDEAGDARVPLVPDTLTLLDANGDPVDTLTVPGEGTWTVTPTNELRFTPEPDFAGVTTPVTYQVADKNGTTTTATATVTVGAAPVAKPDEGTTKQGQPVKVDLVGNDEPGEGGTTPATLVPDSVKLWDEVNQTWATTVTVPGVGTWTVNVGAEGNVEFVPEKSFTGTASLPYQVTDSDGNTAASTVTVTVTPVTPVAKDDPANTPFNTPVTVPVLDNDKAGDPIVPLVPGSLKLIDPETGDPVTTVTIPGQGTWTVTPDNEVTFTPEDGFHGTSTITYQVEDENGTTTTAQVPVTVGTPPTAAPDTATAKSGQNATVDLLENDTPGSGVDGSTTLVPGSVIFTSSEATDGGKKLVVPGEGVWTIDDQGRATFDPDPAFDGPTTPVEYQVTDTDGNKATSTVTAFIELVPPTALPDTAKTPYLTPVKVPVLGNDTPGDPEVPFDPSSVVLIDPTTGEKVKELSVPGEGTWTVTDKGELVFTPAKGFSGPATPVTYEVTDINGQTVNSQVNVTVGTAPVAKPDQTTTAQGTPVTIDPLGNDTPGSGTDNGTEWDRSSLVIIDPATGEPVKELKVPGEGTWTVNPDGTLTFTPEPGFTGEATPITYEVKDTDGNVASSTVAVAVAAVVPIARDDHKKTPEVTPVNLETLSNDEGGVYTPAQAKSLSRKVKARTEVLPNGDVLVPLAPSTLKLVDPAGTLVDKTVVKGEGTWQVVNQDIVFTPVKGFHGLTSKQPYEIRDENGTPVRANETVIVPKTPVPPVDKPEPERPGPDWLPNTGGPALGLLGVGAGLLLAGAWVLRRRRNGEV